MGHQDSDLLGGHPFVATAVGHSSPSMATSTERQDGADPQVVAITDEGLGNTSWVVDLGAHEALVVDPERDPLPYQRVAERLDRQVSLVAETHLHADFVTGSRELAAEGAAVVAPAAGHVEWPHEGLADGNDVDLGRWRLRALATPGHTPEHLAYLLTDATDGNRPRAVFTGGSLLVGSVARTDLIDPDDTVSLTRALWRSLNHQLLALPDDVSVFPTHGTGSFCSAPGGSRRWSTIGDERRSNPLLAAPDEDAFVRQVLGALGTYPPYFLRLREVNRLGPQVFGALVEPPRLTNDQVQALREQGAAIIDVRPVADFTAGHIPGSLANTLRAQFSSWLGWLVPDPETPLVFVAGEHQDRREIVRQAVNIGYENIAGELAGGVETWRSAGGELATIPLVAASQLTGPRRPTVLDVRQTSEYLAGHVPGATHVELGSLPGLISEVADEHLVVMCGHGERATTAASLLTRSGRPDVAVFDGGPSDWVAATGEPLATA